METLPTPRTRKNNKKRKKKRWPLRAIIVFLALSLLVSSAALWFLNRQLNTVYYNPEADALKIAGFKAYNNGSLVSAADKLGRYLKLNETDRKTREMVADIYWQLGDEKRAYLEFKRAHKHAPAGAERSYKLGLLAGRRGRLVESERFLAAAVEAGPDSFRFRLALAKARRRIKRYTESVNDWRRLTTLLNEGDWYQKILQAQIGDTLKAKGDLDGAERAYRLAATGQSVAVAKRSGPDTTIISSTIDRKTGTMKVLGLTEGPATGVELAVRRADGHFYKADSAEWTGSEVWQRGTPVPTGRTGFVWMERLVLPQVDNEPVYVIARAVDLEGAPELLPAADRLFIDSRPPLVERFEVENARWTAKKEVRLVSQVKGAKFMRLAGSAAGLARSGRLRYVERTTFRLAGADGLKAVYGAFEDENGNTSVVKAGGGRFGLDTAPPAVKRLAPAKNAKSVSVDAEISVDFIEGSDIALDSVENTDASQGNFYLTRAGALTTTTIDYDPRKKTLSLKPISQLEEGSVYTAYLKPGIADIAGNKLEEEAVWSFTAVEPTPPETKISAVDEPTRARRVTKIMGQAKDDDGVEAVGVLVIDPDGRYWDGANGAWTKDTFVNQAKIDRPGGRDVSWSWRWRLPASDGSAYTIAAVARDRFLADDKSPDERVVIIDNQPPRPEAVLVQNGAPVSATRSVEVLSRVGGASAMRMAEDIRDLKKQAYEPFVERKPFTLSKKEGPKKIYVQWRDQFGNETEPGAPNSYAEILYDPSGPRVNAVFPQKGAYDVNIAVLVTANFDEMSLDEQSVNTDTLKLLDSAGQPVAATLLYDPVSRTASLSPVEVLAYGAGYTVVLSKDIRDRSGNGLAANYIWDFKTVQVSDHPPGKPRGFNVTATEKGNLLRWRDPGEADQGGDFEPPVKGGYNVYRSVRRDGPFELVNLVPLTNHRYLDKDYSRPGVYHYYIRAVDAGGSEGPDSSYRSNERIDARFLAKKGISATVSPSNNIVSLSYRRPAASTWIRIKTVKDSRAPASAVPLFSLESLKPIKLKTLTVFIGGDPAGSFFMRQSGRSWRPLLRGGNYQYDKISQSVGYGPLSLGGRFILHNRADRTPPSRPDVRLEQDNGKPRLIWRPSSDPESGISGYRLYRADTSAAFALLEETGTITRSLPAGIAGTTETTVFVVPPVAGATSTVDASETTVAASISASTATPALTETPTAMSLDKPLPPGIKVIDLGPDDSEFSDNAAAYGQTYAYALAAVNGSGLAGPPTVVDATSTAAPPAGHRPKVVANVNCRACHLESKSPVNAAGLGCRFCHDGSGSRLLLDDDFSRTEGSFCRQCHALSSPALVKASRAGQVCGNCHWEIAKTAETTTSVHAAGPLNRIICGSCHTLHKPGKKAGYLADPANTWEEWTGTSSDFCLQCHGGLRPRAREAVEVFVPESIIFGAKALQSPLFPGWEKRNWRKAAHRPEAECVTCHQPHKSPNQRLLALKERGIYNYFSPSTALESLCLGCHRPKGPKGAADLWSASRLPFGHQMGGGGGHSDTETAAGFRGQSRHVACVDCHNVHEAKSGRRRQGTNLVSDALLGVSGVEPQTRDRRRPSVDFIEINPAEREYQICYKCHSGYVEELSLGVKDLATDFNPDNDSYHPVESIGRNLGIRKSAFTAGWSDDSTMYCSDCHSGAGRSSVKGAHRSSYRPLLAAAYGPEARRDRQNNLCRRCHNRRVYENGRRGSRFGDGGHALHIGRQKLACFNCHETHGSPFTDHLIKTSATATDTAITNWFHDSSGGSCAAACHQRPTQFYRYEHQY